MVCFLQNTQSDSSDNPTHRPTGSLSSQISTRNFFANFNNDAEPVKITPQSALYQGQSIEVHRKHHGRQGSGGASHAGDSARVNSQAAVMKSWLQKRVNDTYQSQIHDFDQATDLTPSQGDHHLPGNGFPNTHPVNSMRGTRPTKIHSRSGTVSRIVTGTTPVPEEDFEVDIEVVDRYFSSSEEDGDVSSLDEDHDSPNAGTPVPEFPDNPITSPVVKKSKLYGQHFMDARTPVTPQRIVVSPLAQPSAHGTAFSFCFLSIPEHLIHT